MNDESRMNQSIHSFEILPVTTLLDIFGWNARKRATSFVRTSVAVKQVFKPAVLSFREKTRISPTDPKHAVLEDF